MTKHERKMNPTKAEIKSKFRKFPFNVNTVPQLVKDGYLPETAKWMLDAELDFRNPQVWSRAYNELDYMPILDLYKLPEYK